MSRRTDDEFEAIIHEDVDAEPTPVEESEDARHLRAELAPAHAESIDS